MKNQSELLLYQTPDGVTKIETRLQDETVWLTQAQLCELFQKSKSSISEHIKHIFEEGELEEALTVRKFRTVQKEGSKDVEREIEYYNLDVIISVGYRVKSHRGTQFRIWATQRLREYIVKGFTLNDDLLKNGGKGNYFEELLARI
nr:virulence RhuM family protein [Leptospiraceae bacterium]